MQRRICIFLPLVSMVFLLIFAACAPSAPTPSSTTKPAIPQTTSTITPGQSQLTPQEIEWNKVIEAAKTEGSVTMYGGSDFGGPVRQAIIDGFKEKYGIRVSILVGRGQDAQQRIKVEKQINKPVGDMVQLGATSTADFLDEDLADPLERLLPELQINKDKFYYNTIFDPQGKAVGVTDQTTGPMINTNLVKAADEPKSWLDFINPKWKGKILIIDPRRAGSGMNFFQSLQYYKIVDESYFRKLMDLEPGLWGGSSQESNNMVARGEYTVHYGVTFEQAVPLIVEGAPVKFLDMKEGLTVQTGNILLAKGRPHPNAARLLANWIVSADGQRVIHSARGSKPVRNDVPDFTPEKARVNVAKALVRDFKVLETTNMYQDMAQRVFTKK